MKYLLLILVLFVSCSRGEPQQSTQQGDFKVELLFEMDGCKVYRFVDGLRVVYWSNCAGKIQYDHTTSNGKTTRTHHEETINTGE